ncbi:hypothetical protein FKP32DRAFT_1591083 [Trametes sanguinea]|nr:hypothetical protein FKP32DRAFT_1591083 [Trametes sanguinea]
MQASAIFLSANEASLACVVRVIVLARYDFRAFTRRHGRPGPSSPGSTRILYRSAPASNLLRPGDVLIFVSIEGPSSQHKPQFCDVQTRVFPISTPAVRRSMAA